METWQNVWEFVRMKIGDGIRYFLPEPTPPAFGGTETKANPKKKAAKKISNEYHYEQKPTKDEVLEAFQLVHSSDPLVKGKLNLVGGPLNVLMIGPQGVGKSSFVNTVKISLEMDGQTWAWEGEPVGTSRGSHGIVPIPVIISGQTVLLFIDIAGLNVWTGRKLNEGEFSVPDETLGKLLLGTRKCNRIIRKSKLILPEEWECEAHAIDIVVFMNWFREPVKPKEDIEDQMLRSEHDSVRAKVAPHEPDAEKDTEKDIIEELKEIRKDLERVNRGVEKDKDESSMLTLVDRLNSVREKVAHHLKPHEPTDTEPDSEKDSEKDTKKDSEKDTEKDTKKEFAKKRATEPTPIEFAEMLIEDLNAAIEAEKRASRGLEKDKDELDVSTLVDRFEYVRAKVAPDEDALFHHRILTNYSKPYSKDLEISLKDVRGGAVGGFNLINNYDAKFYGHENTKVKTPPITIILKGREAQRYNMLNSEDLPDDPEELKRVLESKKILKSTLDERGKEMFPDKLKELVKNKSKLFMEKFNPETHRIVRKIVRKWFSAFPNRVQPPETGVVST